MKRFVNSELWSDPWIETLDPKAKLLWLYLLTNPKTTMLGVYEMSIRKASFETGLSESEIWKALEQFKSESKAFFLSEQTLTQGLPKALPRVTQGFIWLPNWTKNQSMNPNMIIAAEREFDKLPLWLLDYFKGMNIDSYETLSKGLCKPLEGLPNPSERRIHYSNSYSNSNSITITEPEKKQKAVLRIEYPPDYDTPEVRQSLKDWLTYKQDRKEPYKSAGSIKALFTQAAKSKASPEMFCWAISYAMAKNWRGIGFYPEVIESFSGVAASKNGAAKQSVSPLLDRLLAEAEAEERLEAMRAGRGIEN